MNIRKHIIGATLASTLLFTGLNTSYAAEASIESQLKEQVDQANLEQEIIAIIAEQIESSEKTATSNTVTVNTVAQVENTPSATAVPTSTALKADVSQPDTSTSLNSQVSDGLRKSLQAVVQDAEGNINKQLSDYRKSITPKSEEKKSSETVPKQKQVKRSEPAPQRKTVEKHIAKKAPQKAPQTPSVSSTRKDKGWVYIGQFSDSSWGEKMLKISNELPKAGRNYLLNASVNIRDARPSKSGMSKVVNILSTGDKIKILNIHSSGKKGHYWALVEWLKRR
jgi:hypothetical protein